MICALPDCQDAREQAARVEGLLRRLAALHRRMASVENERENWARIAREQADGWAAERIARLRAERREDLDREFLEQTRARLAEREQTLREQDDRLLVALARLDDYRHDVQLLLAQLSDMEARALAEQETPAGFSLPERRRWQIAWAQIRSLRAAARVRAAVTQARAGGEVESPPLREYELGKFSAPPLGDGVQGDGLDKPSRMEAECVP